MSWKFPKISLPSRVWTITDIVGISDGAWGKLAWIATLVGVAAVITNFCMVVAYAAGVAIDAPLMGDPKGDTVLGFINLVVGIGQVAVAGMLQLGTDFCLLFAAGLAKSKYRFTPLAALALWCICTANTVEMKKDLYEAIGEGRTQDVQAVADAAMPADVVAARALLAQYSEEKPPPVTQAASQAIIDTSTATIGDLEKERAEKDDARAEEAKTGRSTKWQALDDRVGVIDASLTAARAKIEAARIALAERVAFDGATETATRWDTRAKKDGPATGYDDDWAIALRVWGMTLLGLISILVAFAAEKASHDAKEVAADKRRRSDAAYKAAETRAQNRNTHDVQWQEAAPLGAPALPHVAGVEDGATAGAHTRTFGNAPQSKHPDKSGDDYGAGANGYVSKAGEDTGDVGDGQG